MAKNEQSLTREYLAERDVRIFKMRQAGITVSEIAKRFSMTTRAVTSAVRRQLEKMNTEALMAYPELLRLELERLDALQSAIWPMTQHRKQVMDDGSEIQIEPDLKAIQQVLSIMDRRARLLGMEQQNINVNMDVNSNVNVRSTLVGAIDIGTSRDYSPEAEVRKLLEIMGRSNVLPASEINLILGDSPVIDVEVIEDDAETVPVGEKQQERTQQEQG